MQLFAGLVEYVVVHEPAHLKEQHHTPEFWLRVKRVLPDYEQRRTELAHKGGRCGGVDFTEYARRDPTAPSPDADCSQKRSRPITALQRLIRCGGRSLQ